MSPIASLLSLDGLLFVLRWFHTFAGIIWIGILYYFNYVQTPFFAETDPAVRSGAIQKLVPRALWWFRWGALWTVAFGLLILGARGHQMGAGYFLSSRGINIMTGGFMGLIMASNVWFVIWPAQQVVIQNALDTAAGKPANPLAAARGAKAGLASRTNVVFSIPMLFFMGAAVHLPYTADGANLTAYAIGVLIITGLVEANALKGKPGPLATVKGAISVGFALTAVLFGLLCIVF